MIIIIATLINILFMITISWIVYNKTIKLINNRMIFLFGRINEQNRYFQPLIDETRSLCRKLNENKPIKLTETESKEAAIIADSHRYQDHIDYQQRYLDRLRQKNL
jgi:hypothetical protein